MEKLVYKKGWTTNPNSKPILVHKNFKDEVENALADLPYYWYFGGFDDGVSERIEKGTDSVSFTDFYVAVLKALKKAGFKFTSAVEREFEYLCLKSQSRKEERQTCTESPWLKSPEPLQSKRVKICGKYGCQITTCGDCPRKWKGCTPVYITI